MMCTSSRCVFDDVHFYQKFFNDVHCVCSTQIAGQSRKHKSSEKLARTSSSALWQPGRCRLHDVLDTDGGTPFGTSLSMAGSMVSVTTSPALGSAIAAVERRDAALPSSVSAAGPPPLAGLRRGPRSIDPGDMVTPLRKLMVRGRVTGEASVHCRSSWRLADEQVGVFPVSILEVPTEFLTAIPCKIWLAAE